MWYTIQTSILPDINTVDMPGDLALPGSFLPHQAAGNHNIPALPEL
jgi:hypothetical protein